VEFTPLELSHRDKINAYLSAQRIESSELTFLTLYIWRKVFHVEFAETEGCLVLRFQDNGYPPSLRFPLGNGDKRAAVEQACRACAEDGHTPKFYGLTRDMRDALSEMFPDLFEIREMTDYFDYVYTTESLITLSGNRLHSKKNHVNRFKRSYRYDYVPIAAGDADELARGYDAWLAARDAAPDYYLAGERASIRDILENYDALGAAGAKLYADGRLCAFTIGEQLNENTAVIHIEKADMGVNGAYAAMNQMFLERTWSGLEFVNREDDFGLEGLRKAKRSYHPAFMVEKYSATLK
jgi:hypothetical protein